MRNINAENVRQGEFYVPVVVKIAEDGSATFEVDPEGAPWSNIDRGTYWDGLGWDDATPKELSEVDELLAQALRGQAIVRPENFVPGEAYVNCDSGQRFECNPDTGPVVTSTTDVRLRGAFTSVNGSQFGGHLVVGRNQLWRKD